MTATQSVTNQSRRQESTTLRRRSVLSEGLPALLSPGSVIAQAMTAVVLGIMLILSNVARLEAQNDNQQGEDESSLIQQGFAIAPVPLNLSGRNRSLVGLGSYLVNAVGDCNGCHTSGSPSSLFIYPYKAG
jgi:hypothetical protein